MDLSLTHEQELLGSSLSGFLAKRYDRTAARTAVRTGARWTPELWNAFAGELEILGALLPERVGGTAGGPVEMMVIMEALGLALVLEPVLETVVIGAGLLEDLGGDGTDDLLTGITAGTVRTAFAATEPTSGYDFHDVTTTASEHTGGWVLNGAKCVVTGGPIATHLLITVRTSGGRRDTDGISLFCVPFDAGDPPPGVQVHGYRTIDDRRACDVTFDDVELPPTALIGGAGAAWSALGRAIDRATTAVAAEAVGCMRRVLTDTLAYTKQREQFGVPLSTFQVLQHRMVDMHLEIEQSVAAVYRAVMALDAEPVERGRAVSAAKATIGRAARFVGQNAVQLHGGMGMTEELAIGHYFQRLTAIEYEFGPADHHIARYAALTRPS